MVKDRKIIKTAIIYLIVFAVCPALVLMSYFLFGNDKIYLFASVLSVIAVLPVFIRFEKKQNASREVSATAALTAAAVASRAAFYFLPQVKPIGAVCIIAAVSFGAEEGFLVGALSMFLSNFIFGQGSWTPFQMLGMGLTCFICGLIAKSESLKRRRIIFPFILSLVQFIVYGFTVDTDTALYISSPSFETVFSVYLAGAPFNLIFAATTLAVLVLILKPVSERLDRLKKKYGIFEEKN